MSTVQITYAAADITDNVIFSDATFTTKLNGQIGTAYIRVKDIDQSYTPITGQRLTLVIDGRTKWSGYGIEVSKRYAFPAQDTSGTPTRFWEIRGVDDNVLFDKRIVFDPNDPAGHIDFSYMPGTYDDTIINDLFDNYLDLSDDNITRAGVTRVREAILDIPGIISARGSKKTLADWEGTINTGTIAAAGYTWAQSMDVIQRATGAIYYIDGVSDPDERILCYVDVETVTSEYTLSDNLSNGIGYREFSIIENGTHLTNHMHVWGAALGAAQMVHSEYEGETSIVEHGRWVDGLFSSGLYKQVSADLVAETWVEGTPQSKRGKKDDQLTFQCRTFSSVFNVGEVVNVQNSIFGFEASLPLREMEITFAAPWIPIFDLTLGHEIDQPWSFYESLRKMPRPLEIEFPNWAFPPLPPRLPYCPVPSLLLIAGRAMLPIYERDFGGDTAEEPVLWQDPPYGALHLDDALVPQGLTETFGPPGFIPSPSVTPAPSTYMELRTPTSGAIEILAALDMTDASEGDLFFTVGSYDQLQFAWGTFEGVPYSEVLFGSDLVGSVPTSHARRPLWVRLVFDPGIGKFAKIWPRMKPEPLAWDAELTGGEGAVIGDIGYLLTGGSTRGLEAISVYAEHSGDEPLSFGGLYSQPQDEGGVAAGGVWAGWPIPVPEGDYFGSGYQDGFSRFVHDLNELPECEVLQASPIFAGSPEFTPWSSEYIIPCGFSQKIVMMSTEHEHSAEGFSRKAPASITISGELKVTGYPVPAPYELPFPLTLSLNSYDYGLGDPFLYPYEVMPSARHYVYFNQITQGPDYWVPFEFTIPGDSFQWGVTIVDDTLPLWRNLYAAAAPPFDFNDLRHCILTVQLQNVTYKATYVTDAVGFYWCVPGEPQQVEGDSVGFPAYDTGDQRTYRVATSFVAGSTSVWVNGIVQVFGETEAYTENPAEGLIVFNTPLDPDDEVIVDYTGFGPAWGP